MGFRTEDVLMVATTIRGRLILIGIALLAMVVCLVLMRAQPQPRRRLMRVQSVVAFVLITAICLNTVLLRTYRDTLNTYFADKLSISDEARSASADVVERVVDEGIVLAQNDGGLLPLAERKLNVFGWASISPIYGGSGSGASDESGNVSILQGLEQAGITVNQSLVDFYKAYRTDRPAAETSVQDFTLPEPVAASYTKALLSEAEAFSSTAMLVLGRVGGECFDLPTDMASIIHNPNFQPDSNSLGLNGTYTNNGDYEDFEAGQHYLSLSRTERDLVDLVCSHFSHVIVLYNGNNPFELGWTEDYSQIQSVLLCPGTGATGFISLGKILTGEVNPSGRTVDTWLYDLTQTPYYQNFGDFHYTNLDAYTAQVAAADVGTIDSGTFVQYVEGIYVGYKYYETADAEGFIDYASSVKYPFGYGLSYTSFSQQMGALSESDGQISLDVTVTNTGSVAGKDVVQVYYTPPYTNGGIEKAAANLIQFEKTDLLQPGESQTLTIRFERDDMASFDAHGAGCYVLEAGDYLISLRQNSHEVIDTQVYTQDTTLAFDNTPRSTDQQAARSCLQDAEGTVTFLSRADHFANYDRGSVERAIQHAPGGARHLCLQRHL